MPLISSKPVAASEGAGFVDFVVSLDAAASTEVRVSYQTGNVTAAYGSDYVFARDVLVFAPGQTSKTVRIALTNDILVESAEVFWLELYSPVNGTIDQPNIPALIADNDFSAGTPVLLVSSPMVDEGAKTVSFFVGLNRPSSTPVSVNFATDDGSARAGQDFDAAAGLLSFAPGETVKTVVVNLIDDTLPELDESFALRLSNASGATIADPTPLALIGRNDGDPVGAPTVFVAPFASAEGAPFASFAVQLSAPSNNEVRVSYQTQNVSAAYNSDYSFMREQLVFAPGQTLKMVQVPLLVDTTVEATEVFWVELYSPISAVIAQPNTPGLLFDNDGSAATSVSVTDVVVDEGAQLARFFVALNKASSTAVTVPFATADDSAVAGQDYSATAGNLIFAPGELVKTVLVPITNDTLSEPDEFFKLVLGNASGAAVGNGTGLATIGRNDNDPVSTPQVFVTPIATGEGEVFASFMVQLSSPSTNEVRVSYQTDNATAAYNTDYEFMREPLVFAPGETSKVVQVPLINGSVAEPTEVFWLQLYSPVNAVIARPYTPALIVDNDGITGTPAISVTDVVVDEAAQTARLFVTLNRPSVASVSVAYATTDDSAAAGSDYAATSGTLNFAPGEVVKTVIVKLVDDATPEPDEYFKLALSAPNGATLADTEGLVLIGRNDSATVSTPYLLVSPVAVSEGDSFATFALQLSNPSGNEVRVSYQTDNGTATYNADYQFAREQLVFAPGDTTKYVQVPLLNDTVAEAAAVFWLNLYSPVNAVVPVPLTPVLIYDNDGIAGTPAVSIGDAVVNESTQHASFFVWLDRVSTSTVTVNYSSDSDTASRGDDFRAASGALSFAPGEMVKTVFVDVFSDALTEAQEAFKLQLSAPVNATLADALGVGLIGRGDGPTVSRPQVFATPASAGEGGTFASVLVQLSAPSSNEVRVSYQTDNATAAYNSDYQFDRQQLVFAPGDTLKVVRITLLNDTVGESTESFNFTLYSPVNATIAQTSTAVTLYDDDSGGKVFSFGLSNDQYTLTGVLDRVVESPGGGIDTVRSGFSYTLPENVENLVLTGSALNAIGNAGNNLLRGTAANNTFDGQGGIDTVVFSGPAAAYTVAGNLASRTVSSTADGSDSLFSIERLQFSDTIRASDTTAGGNTYLAYAMFNAGFDRAPSTAELSQWTSTLDRLGNTRDLAQAMINAYAPGVPDDVLVAHLWGTIVESPIPIDALRQYVGLVGDGTYTQASLLELVTTLDLNTVEIVGIVGSTLTLDPAYFAVPG